MDGLERIMNAELLNQTQKVRFMLWNILMTPQDAMKDIFINDPLHTGCNNYAIIFRIDNLQKGNIIQSSELEYTHSDRLKLGEVFHAGKNPYGILPFTL